MKQAYSTKQAADILGISFRTIKNWIYNGKIKTFITPTKQHRITNEELNKILNKPQENKTATYSRVSTNKQKEDLERQHQRNLEYCKLKGYNVIKSYQEISSGLNDKRTKLNKLLNEIANKEINCLVIENINILTRFGYKYLELFCISHGTKLEITNNTTNKEDLVKDLIDIVTCFCAKLYGKRSNKTKTKQEVTNCIDKLKP